MKGGYCACLFFVSVKSCALPFLLLGVYKKELWIINLGLITVPTGWPPDSSVSCLCLSSIFISPFKYGWTGLLDRLPPQSQSFFFFFCFKPQLFSFNSVTVLWFCFHFPPSPVLGTAMRATWMLDQCSAVEPHTSSRSGASPDDHFQCHHLPSGLST